MTGVSVDYKYTDGMTLRFNQGSQINLHLIYPGKQAPGRKVMTVERKNMKPEDMILRQEVFDMAKRLGPKNDIELAAIRDTVLLQRQMEPGTPGFPKGPGTPGPKRAPTTPGPKMPGTPGLMGPPRPPGAASGSGASGSGAY
jgi:hypothetical protein